jgi:hypothetical protein
VAAHPLRRFGAAELRDVGARGEDALAAPHHDGAGRVEHQRADHLGELLEQRHGEGVGLGPVEAHEGDPVVAALEPHECHSA